MRDWKGVLVCALAIPMVMMAASGNGERSSVAAATPPGQAGSAPASGGSTVLEVERLDPALAALVPDDAKLETVASGFTWVEGPVWTPGGYLLFAEITSNSIRKLTPNGTLTTFLQPSGYLGTEPFAGKEPGSNGMTLDAKGRLTVAGHARRNVYRLESLEPGAKLTVLADSYQGKKLNSPNDLVYKSDGSLYFTDPPYGLPGQSETDPGKELPMNGVYRIPHAASQPAGAEPKRAELQLLVRDLPRPNGIAFSPDEKFLYVNSTQPRAVWMKYPVKADGTVGEGTLFFDATGDKRVGAPDGMKVDTRGNVYSTGPGGIWIFSPEGKHLGTLLLPERAANVAWGGADAKTLYITMSNTVRRVRLNIAGVRPVK